MLVLQETINPAMSADNQRHAGSDGFPRNQAKAFVPGRHQRDAGRAQFGVKFLTVLGVRQRVQIDDTIGISLGELLQIGLGVARQRRCNGGDLGLEIDAAQYQFRLSAQGIRHACLGRLALGLRESGNAEMTLLDPCCVIAEAATQESGKGSRRVTHHDVCQPGDQHANRLAVAQQVEQRIPQQGANGQDKVGLPEERFLLFLLVVCRPRVLCVRLVGRVAHVVNQRRAATRGSCRGNGCRPGNAVMSQPDGGLVAMADIAAPELVDGSRRMSPVEDLFARGIRQRHERHPRRARFFDLLGSGAGDNADDLCRTGIGEAKGADKIGIETVDPAVLAAPLRGKRNQ